MPQVNIVSGIYKSGADYRESYPVNYYPAVMQTGISKAYLRPSPGLVQFVATPGRDRGAIEFKGSLYRVCGSRLVRISPNGVVTDIGYVPGIGKVSIARGFDRFCIVANGQGFYYIDGGSYVQITDPNFTIAFDVVFLDGYFIFTDGEFVFPSELSNPLAFDPLKYGSAEIDSDPIQSLKVVRNELYACGSRTIEVYQNVGGSGFPFQRISGAVINKGVSGRYSAIEVEDSLFFVGEGRDESASVYIGAGGRAQRVATDEIDKILSAYTTQQLDVITVDVYSLDGCYFALIHLPDQSLCFDIWGSQKAGVPLWHVRKAAGNTPAPWRCVNPVRVYGKWIGGDPVGARACEIRNDIATEYGAAYFREFSTPLGYAEGRGVIVHDLEMVGANSVESLTAAPQISLSVSRDGVTYGQERWTGTGKRGAHGFTPKWRQVGRGGTMMTFRFRVANDSLFAPARLEASYEVLSV